MKLNINVLNAKTMKNQKIKYPIYFFSDPFTVKMMSEKKYICITKMPDEVTIEKRTFFTTKPHVFKNYLAKKTTEITEKQFISAYNNAKKRIEKKIF